MTTPTRWLHTVVLAGGPAEPDPLSVEAGVATKALLPIAGRPMVAHVLQALQRCDAIGPITVVGLEASLLEVICEGPPLRCLPNHHGIVDNILAATEGLDDATPVLVVSADIPLLTPEAVSSFIQSAELSGGELCYAVVERAVMEARFPGSGRSFRHTREGDFAGGDLFLATPRLFRTHAGLARGLSDQRKSAWGLARLLGLGVLWRLATRRLTIRSLEARASTLLGCDCKAIISEHPELAMDVDKPHQLTMIRHALTLPADTR
ncbi:MAG: NTP transferase domain-containing protein [Anaerolineae bacterium]|jgi:GTP:adenosylcobinamide-phosphate guanylyltransferase